MKLQLSVPAQNKNTDVIIEPKALKQLSEYFSGKSKVVILADQNVLAKWQDQISEILPENSEIVGFDAGDQNKNLATYETLLNKLKQAGLDRKSLVVSLGGGVTCDIVGFVASSYMRGVDWIALPTTLIAQTDAAIGGKTGVNLGGYKNMVGTFWPPLAVLVDPEFLTTLDIKHLRNGLAEIIKMGIICDQEILKIVENIDPNSLLGEPLNQASALSAKNKIDIVNRDMYEAGERKVVNFGHTIGHAIEAISHESDTLLLHGEAIAIGCVGATKLAELEGVCPEGTLEKVKRLFEKYSLPTNFNEANLDQIRHKIASDKKNQAGEIYWTLPTRIGENKYNHVAKNEHIDQAINQILQ